MLKKAFFIFTFNEVLVPVLKCASEFKKYLSILSGVGNSSKKKKI